MINEFNQQILHLERKNNELQADLAKAEAENARLVAELESLRSEMNIRGDFLHKVVAIRKELVDDKSNSWLDSIDAIRDRLVQLQSFANRVAKPFSHAASNHLTYNAYDLLWKFHEEARKLQVATDDEQAGEAG